MLRFFFANLFALFFVTVFIVACGGPELNSGKATTEYFNPWENPAENNGDKSKVKPLSTQTGSSSEEKGWATATDSLGNVYVTGSTLGIMPNSTGLNMGGTNVYLIKYNSAGTKVWTRQFGTDYYEEGTAVAVDLNGNIYVGGNTQGALVGQNAGTESPTWDLFVRKYDTAGTVLWTKQWGTDKWDILSAITLDNTSTSIPNIYVAGTTGGTFGTNGTTKYDGFMSKITQATSPNTATVQWNKQWRADSGTNNYTGAYGIAVTSDTNHYIYVVGNTYGSYLRDCYNTESSPCHSNQGLSDNLLIKFYGNTTTAPDEIWLKQWGTSSYDYLSDIALDTSNNLYISGHTMGGLYGTNQGGYDLFVVKFDANMNFWSNPNWPIWFQQWQISSTADENTSHIALDNATSQNVYVSGTTAGNLGGQTNHGGTDIFSLKLANNGTKLWVKEIGSNLNEETKSLAVDANGTIYVAGHTQGSLFGYPKNGGPGDWDMFLYKDAGEVAHYRLEQDVTDATGNYNGNGIYNGAYYNRGYIGYGVALDGVNDIVNLADFNPRSSGGAYSISMWVQPGSGGYAQHAYIDKQLSNSTVDNVFSFGQDNSLNPKKLYVKIRNSTLTCDNVEDTANWTHFALSMYEDGASTVISIYRNGELLLCTQNLNTVSGAVSAQIGTTITGKLWIAGANWASNSALTNLFKGMVDDIRFYNKTLTPNEVVDLFQYPQIDDNYSNSDILATYSFDNDFNDSTGHGFNGNNTSVSFVDGHENKAARFNGTDAYGNLGTFDPRNGGDSYAISLWVKPEYGTLTVSDHTYIGLNSASTGNADLIDFGVYSNYIKVRVRDQNLNLNLNEPQNVWTHYTISFLEKATQTLVTAYRNGVYIASGTLDTAIGNEPSFLPWTIGCEWDSSVRAKFFKGQMDHVRFYSRQLNDKEAWELFQYDDGMIYCSDIDLKGTCMRAIGAQFDLSSKYWFLRSGSNWVFPKSTVNDNISSVKLAKNWEAYLCQDSNHNGTCKYFNGVLVGGSAGAVTYNLTTYSFNDTASSFTVQPLNFEKAKEYYGFKNVGDYGNAATGFAYFYAYINYQKPTVPNGPKRLFMNNRFVEDYSISDTTNYIIKDNLVNSVELYGNVTAKLYDSTLLETDEHSKVLITSHRNFGATDFSYINYYHNYGYARYTGLDFTHYQGNVRGITLNPYGDKGSIGWFEASDNPDNVANSAHLSDLCLLGANTLDYRLECNRASGPRYYDDNSNGLQKNFDFISMDHSVSANEYYSRVTDTEFQPYYSTYGGKAKFQQYGDNYNLLFLMGHGNFFELETVNPTDEYPDLYEATWNTQLGFPYRYYIGSSSTRPEGDDNLLNSGMSRDNFQSSPTDFRVEFTDGEWSRVIGQQATKWMMTNACRSMGLSSNSIADRIDAWKYPLERLHGVGGMENDAGWPSTSSGYDYFWTNLTTTTISEAYIDSFTSNAAPRRARYLTRESCDCTDTTNCTSYMVDEYFYGVEDGPRPDKGDLSQYSYYCWRAYNAADISLPPVPLTLYNDEQEFPSEAAFYEIEYDKESDIKKALKLDESQTTDFQSGKKLTENNIVYSEDSFYLFKGRKLVPAGLKATTQELDKAHREEAFYVAKSLSNLSLQLDSIAKDEMSSFSKDYNDSYTETGRLVNKIKYTFIAALDGLPVYGDSIEVDYDGAGLYKMNNSLPARVKQVAVSKLKSKTQVKDELGNMGVKEADIKDGKLMYAKDGLGYLRPALVYTDSATQGSKIYFIDGGE